MIGFGLVVHISSWFPELNIAFDWARPYRLQLSPFGMGWKGSPELGACLHISCRCVGICTVFHCIAGLFPAICCVESWLVAMLKRLPSSFWRILQSSVLRDVPRRKSQRLMDFPVKHTAQRDGPVGMAVSWRLSYTDHCIPCLPEVWYAMSLGINSGDLVARILT